MKADVIIVAAGQSRRMNGVDKTFADILGKPVIAHTISAFENAPSIDSIVLVVQGDKADQFSKLILQMGFKKVKKICSGGTSRQQSVHNGLEFTNDADVVLIHDGARPCVRVDTIELGIVEAIEHGAAIAGSDVYDTIKSVNGDGFVSKTLNRNELRAIHTPQSFKRDILECIHKNLQLEMTDDAGLAEALGYKVKVYQDYPDNIKITTQYDLAIAQAILQRNSNIIH